VRTTLTLDEDVAAKLKSEARRSGQSLRAIVNEVSAAGLPVIEKPTRRRLSGWCLAISVNFARA
jgi:hypothetical protein